MDQDFYYRNLQFITLTNKKNIYQDSQYLLNDIYFKKSTDFERITNMSICIYNNVVREMFLIPLLLKDMKWLFQGVFTNHK